MGRAGRVGVCAGALCLAVSAGIWMGLKRSGSEVENAQTFEFEAQGSIVERFLEQAGAMGVRLEAGKTAGSGIICSADEEKLYIVTAAHVLEDGAGASVCVVFCDGATADCRDFWIAEGADLAFLEIEKKELAPGTLRACRRAVTDKQKYDGLICGDAVLCMGYSGEGKLAGYKGFLTDNWIYVEDFAQYMIVADCEVEPGMSGGGLFDRQGYLIGIVCGGNEQGELAAVPLHVAQAKFMERYG